MNFGNSEILKRVIFESLINKDFNKFNNALKEVRENTVKSLIEECSKKIKEELQ